MGKLKNGILGGFSGKVGNVVGVVPKKGRKRTDPVMRAVPKKSNRPATALQKYQRERLKCATTFLKPFIVLLRGWQQLNDDDDNNYRTALSWHMRKALTGTGPQFGIDYSKVILTRGELPLPARIDMSAAGSAVQFNWTDNSGHGVARASDLFLAVFYNDNKKDQEYDFSASRSAGTMSFHLPADWAGDVVHCWVSFVSKKWRRQGNGVYLGVV
jgi:hypothetical protein